MAGGPLKYKATAIIGALTALVGVVIITGWVLKIELLASFFPGFPTVKFNTALGFVFAGAGLFFAHRGEGINSLRVVQVLSLLLMLLGAAELSEYLFKYNAHIDEFFVADRFDLSGGVAGRMAAGTALCFMLSGFGLAGCLSKHREVRITAQLCLHFITLATIVACVGYLFRVPTFYKFLMLNSMAPVTAIAFFFFSVGAAFLHPELGFAELFTGKYTGNIMARKIYPRILLGIIILAFLRIEYDRYFPDLVDAGIALFGLGVLIILLFIVWHTSLLLNNLDIKRTEAEDALVALNKGLEKTVEKRSEDLKATIEKLKTSEDSMRLLVEGVKDYAIYMVDPTGRIMSWNTGAQNIKGYTAEEALGKPISIFYTVEEAERGEPEYNLEIALHQGQYETEGWRIRKNGSKFWASILITPVYEKGKLLGFSKITRDITGKKRAEEVSAREAVLVQTMPDAIVYGTANDFTITSMNKAAEELFGVPLSAARGKRVNDLVRVQLVGTSSEIVRDELWNKKGIWRGELLITTMDGRHLTVLATAKTMQDYTGRDTGWFTIYSDITALKDTEERLELAFEGTTAGLWDWDIKRDKRWWSPRYFELLGYKFNEITPGRETLQQLVHPDDAAMFFTTLQRNFSKPGRFEMEARYKMKSGEYRWFQAIGKTKFADNGEPLRMVGSILDIDEKKKAMKLINQQAELIKTLPDGIIYGDMDFKIISLNKGAEDLFEVTSEQAKGRHIEDVVKYKIIGNREINKKELWQKGFMRYEGELTSRSGKKVTLLATIRLITDVETGKPGWVCIYTDITPLRLNEELKEALLKLEAHNEYLEQLAYISAHDVKAPIIALAGLTGVLQKSDGVKPEYADVMGMITDKIRQMERTNQSLNNILKLRKNLLLEKDKDEAAVTLRVILDEVLTEMENEITGTGSNIKVELDGVAEMRFPYEHFKGVLHHLISNAIKYRAPERPMLLFVKGLRKNDGGVLITVEDNGLGFDLSQQKNKLYGIFKRFHSHAEGTGVGLHIVKSIVDAYGGQIEVESEVGKGTTFKIMLNSPIN